MHHRTETCIFYDRECRGPPAARVTSNFLGTRYRLDLHASLQRAYARDQAAGNGAFLAGDLWQLFCQADSGKASCPCELLCKNCGPAHISHALCCGAVLWVLKRREPLSPSCSCAGCGVPLPARNTAQVLYKTRLKGFMKPRRCAAVAVHKALIWACSGASCALDSLSALHLALSLLKVLQHTIWQRWVGTVLAVCHMHWHRCTARKKKAG